MVCLSVLRFTPASLGRYFGKHGSNALVLRRWYRKFQARNEHDKLLARVSKLQAIHRARMEHKAQSQTNASLIRLQAWSPQGWRTGTLTGQQ